MTITLNLLHFKNGASEFFRKNELFREFAKLAEFDPKEEQI